MIKLRKVEIYQLYTPEGIIQRAEWKNKEEVERLIQLLTNSRDQPNFQPNTEKEVIQIIMKWSFI
ncbi:hypothetical protein ACA29_16625 [Lederbergia galactosidilytica]|uniref:Uncharacterized protein n=1 Tax=Lederbergia galactosidilytica TaxID=217031 RepID=A0A0Q9XT03_9BACI|nr:hypothetical protein ACA29_16625 [Lederbergia galactosidilytica]